MKCQILFSGNYFQILSSANFFILSSMLSVNRFMASCTETSSLYDNMSRAKLNNVNLLTGARIAPIS